MSTESSRSLGPVLAAAEAAVAKTLEPTVILRVGDLISITEHFVITAGRNDRQVRAIVDEVGRRCRGEGLGPPRHVEGLAEGKWVLIDYGDFVVHVFDAEAREYYGLERLWSDAETVPFESELSGVATESSG